MDRDRIVTTYKKKLIEVAIPLEAINAASAREKSIRHGHPSTLHLWWARRPLAACRAVLFAQLVDDPSSHPDKFPTGEAVESERKRLFQIIEDLVKWENSTNEEILERASAEIRKSCDGEMPPVYDPFSGGCSIPLEAQRLGLPAFGSDLNPVAVLIGKALIEIPFKFLGRKPVNSKGNEKLHYENVQGLAEDVRFYGKRIKEKAKLLVGHLYPQANLPAELGGRRGEVIAYLWCRTIPSPNPAFASVDVPLVRTFSLLRKPQKRVWVEPLVDKKNGSYRFVIKRGQGKEPEGTISRNGGVCIVSGDAIPLAYIRQQAQAGNMRQKLMAVVVETPGGRDYIEPDEETEELALSVSPEWRPSVPIPLKHRNFQTPIYGMPTFGDVFTDRQAVAINAFVTVLGELKGEILDDATSSFGGGAGKGLIEGGDKALAYTQAIMIYLAFSVSKATTRNCALAIWEPGMGRLAGAMGRQALPMQWAFAETNPFAGAGGDIAGTALSVSEVLDALIPSSSGNEFQRNASEKKLMMPAPVISTDPPYYDNIEYAELSDFFYVWLRRSLSEDLSSLFQTIVVPKQEELVASSTRYGGREQAEKHFLEGMTSAIRNMVKEAREGFPVSIYYAFKQSEINDDGISSTGWAIFLEAVLGAGFSVVGTWPLRTEATNALKKGMNALASSVVLICRKRKDNADTITRAEFVRALKCEFPSSLAELQAANIAPADMPQSAIGPGMGIFSRYKAVLEADDTPMIVKTALQLINRELDEYLSDVQGEFEADTRFAITWFEQNGYSSGEFGIANNIAQARGISVDSVKHAGIVESSARKVRILKRGELRYDWEPSIDTHLTIWKCCQYLVRALENEGEGAAALLIKKMGSDKAEAVKDLAYCLYDICSNKRKDAKEATAYNALISVWTDLTSMAATIDVRGDDQTSLDL